MKSEKMIRFSRCQQTCSYQTIRLSKKGWQRLGSSETDRSHSEKKEEKKSLGDRNLHKSVNLARVKGNDSVDCLCDAAITKLSKC